MSYRKFINVRMADAMHAALHALAAERRTDVAKLVRQLIARELAGAPDLAAEQREQILFLAIAADNFLAAQPDQHLRDTTIQMWRDRLAEEAARHGV